MAVNTPASGAAASPVRTALRPLGTTELLDTAVRETWAHRRAVLPVAVPFAVVATGLGSLLTYARAGHSGLSVPTLLGSVLVTGLIATVLTGLIAPVISGGLLGGPMTARAALRSVGVRVFGLILLAVVVTLAEGVGLVLVLVGGAWLWGLWAVAAPAFTLERLGPFAALRRSAGLVRGDFWRVWGVRALGRLVLYVVGLVATVPFQAVALAVARVHSFGQAGQYIERPGLYTAILAVGTLVSQLVTTPVAATVDVLLYTDLRMRREGMDIVLGLPPRTATLSTSAPGPTW